MNRGRALLASYALVVAALCLWVPWENPVDTEARVWKFAGYHEIWSPPRIPPYVPSGDIFDRVAAEQHPQPPIIVARVVWPTVLLEFVALSAFFLMLYAFIARPLPAVR